MIGIDTNVLVRLLTADDEGQGERARRAIGGSEDAGEPVLVNDVVLVETMWTMARHYKTPRAQLLDIARGILDTKVFAFENRVQLEEAVDLFEHSSADFSDCLIVAKNLAFGCRATLTFDAACLKLPSAQSL